MALTQVFNLSSPIIKCCQTMTSLCKTMISCPMRCWIWHDASHLLRGRHLGSVSASSSREVDPEISNTTPQQVPPTIFLLQWIAIYMQVRSYFCECVFPTTHPGRPGHCYDCKRIIAPEGQPGLAALVEAQDSHPTAGLSLLHESCFSAGKLDPINTDPAARVENDSACNDNACPVQQNDNEYQVCHCMHHLCVLPYPVPCLTIP